MLTLQYYEVADQLCHVCHALGVQTYKNIISIRLHSHIDP